MATGAVHQAEAGGGTAGFLPARDPQAREIDLSPLRPLLDRLVATWRPECIWLFGSRARGEAQHSSDWDVLAVVPDDVPEDELSPLRCWRLRKESRTRADIVSCYASDFREARDTPNTLAFEVARHGVLLYER